jgi:hypothetical protein
VKRSEPLFSLRFGGIREPHCVFYASLDSFGCTGSNRYGLLGRGLAQLAGFTEQ